CFFFQAEDGIRDRNVTGVQTCALPIFAHFFPSAAAFGGDVVYLNHISILKEQSTPAAFSFLFLKEFPQRSTKHVVLAEPLTPIQQLSIIGGRLTFHFDVSLDMREAVCPQF